MPSIAAVQPLHVASWVELQAREQSAPSVRQQLAAVRHLFDRLAAGQVIQTNPAASVHGPAHVVRQGKTPVLNPAEVQTLLDSIDVSTPVGLHDQVLIALMVLIGAALAMRVEDVLTQDRRLWVRLREKGGKRHEMPCHHALGEYLHAYLDGTGIAVTRRGRCSGRWGGGTCRLTRRPLPQASAHAMVRRRTAAAGIEARIGTTAFGRRASPPS